MSLKYEGRRREGKEIEQLQKDGRQAKPSPPPSPLMRGGSFPQESTFFVLAAELEKFAFTRVYLYTESYSQEDNQIHAGINALESGRHEIIACIARASIGNRMLWLI